MTLNKEPVAVIHYTDGADKSYTAYSADNMLQMIKHCVKKGFTYYVCLTSLDTIIPISPEKHTTAFNSLMEYVGKADNSNSQHRALREVTRTKQVRHPPTIEQVKKAYGVQ